MKPTWESDCGSVRLFLGDALTILPDLPVACCNALVTDPPWMDYQTGHYDATAHHHAITELAPEAYMGMCFRALKWNSAALVWCRWDSFHAHAVAAAASGFAVKNCVVWGKSNHTMGDLDGNMGYKHEQAVFAVKGKWKRPGKREVNLWNVKSLFSRGHRDHPTEKPLALMVRSVEALCPVGATVLDPFFGCGVAGEACAATGRGYVGCEIKADYFDIAVARAQRALAERAAQLPFEEGKQ